MIYLPIEVVKRELVGKVFMATFYASKGFEACLFRSDIFDLFCWPIPGTYIGKNCFRTEMPTNLKYYKKMKAADIDLMYLDEEGAVYSGRSKSEHETELLKRIDPSILEKNDVILTWGSWQEHVLKAKGTNAKVIATGSPNFEILKPEYNSCFRSYDTRITKGEKDFILINTRFSFSNGQHELNSKVDNLRRKTIYLERSVENGLMQYKLIQLIRNLAKALPLETFVFRPHPVENEELYKYIFGDLSNVLVISRGDVSPWIRNCKFLIHNGCTTAIQAKIAGKKILTFVPETDANASVNTELPNECGLRLKDFKSMLSAITSNNPQKFENHAGRSNIDNYFHGESFWLEMERLLPQIYKRDQVTAYFGILCIKFVAVLYSLRLSLRLTFRKISTKGTNQKSDSSYKKYDLELIDEIDLILEAANMYFKSKVKLSKHSKYLFIFHA